MGENILSWEVWYHPSLQGTNFSKLAIEAQE